ncbi:MAG: hypothetical protein ACI3ZS_00725 [Candidatus Cryptobacteroides sp.]
MSAETRETAGHPAGNLSVLIAITAISGVAAIPQWLIHGHSTLGGVHGKTGFLFILICIFNIIRHRKWFGRISKIGMICHKNGKSGKPGTDNFA